MTITCNACGLDEAAELVDAKDDGSGDYTIMHCIRCYGMGYDMLDPAHASLSLQPSLAWLYEVWIEFFRLRDVIWC